MNTTDNNIDDQMEYSKKFLTNLSQHNRIESFIINKRMRLFTIFASKYKITL